MEDLSLSPDPGLDQLMSQAVDYAEQQMRELGCLDATLIISSPEGRLMMPAGHTGTVAAKDEFASVARLFCIAHAATLAVLVVEAWVVMGKDGQPADRSVPPSLSPDRQEFVVVLGEATGVEKQSLHPILRTETGEFKGFGHAILLPPCPADGRFARLLPVRTPRKGERKIAESLLKSMGVTRGGCLALN